MAGAAELQSAATRERQQVGGRGGDDGTCEPLAGGVGQAGLHQPVCPGPSNCLVHAVPSINAPTMISFVVHIRLHTPGYAVFAVL